jgi:hypothetical protein
MKLSEARSAYYEFSKTLSEINRKLGFAGIALIWLFKQGTDSNATVPSALRIPAIAIVLALVLDFLQYVWSTTAWAAFARHKEKKKVKSDENVDAPDWINRPTLLFFWSKILVMAFGYSGILRYLFGLIA